jgi:hypothetical protein
VAQEDNQTKKRLIELIADLDDVGRLDPESNELYVDEGSLRKLLKKHGSKEFEEQAMTHLQRWQGSRLSNLSGAAAGANGIAAARLVPIRWEALVGRVDELRPAPDATLAALQLNASSTEDEVNRAIKARFPNMPDRLFEQDRLRRVATIVAGSGAPTSTAAPNVNSVRTDFWSCLVDNMGFWAALAALTICLAITIAFFAALGPGGVFVWAIFWQQLLITGLVFVVGVNVLTITLFCLTT